ncbi:hypothetical protein BGZ61DRAFT_453856, partial [Ilyonectria robusta]|uniref:uncharacterized protein n=1 Tax=Ilyonectria robusta TaxID=1079257 RepID=UPI001E8EEF2D
MTCALKPRHPELGTLSHPHHRRILRDRDTEIRSTAFVHGLPKSGRFRNMKVTLCHSICPIHILPSLGLMSR